MFVTCVVMKIVILVVFIMNDNINVLLPDCELVLYHGCFRLSLPNVDFHVHFC